MAQKFRNYCYTLNNYTLEEYNALQTVECKYQIIGKEIGEKGTPHLQGFISFKSARSFNAVRKLMKRWYIEPCKGNAESNIKYCMKENNFIEIGESPRQGKRSDIKIAKEMAIAGKSMKEIVLEVNSFQAIRCAELVKKYVETQRNFKTYVYWFYGPTGGGKSRCAQEMFPEAYWCMSTGKWWEGYDGQEVVVINDYRKDFCKFHELLNLLDRYPMRVECKGGSRQFTSKTIVITTPKDPVTTWENRTDEDLGQLMRRIDNILFFGNGTGTGTEVEGNSSASTSLDDEIV